jgi:molybdopterin converting factor small subunit
MRLVFLGKLGDLAPAEFSDVALPGNVRTLAELKDWIAGVQPLLGSAMATAPVRLVVNNSVAHDLSAAVCEGDEVAFLPPMSGG